STCVNLVEVVLHSGLQTIGANAFYGCTKLQSIYIPETVTNIGNNAFQGCAKLTNVAFAGDLPTYGSFGSGVFDSVSADLVIHGPDTVDGVKSNIKTYCENNSILFNTYTPPTCFVYTSDASGTHIIISGLRNHVCNSGHADVVIPAVIDGKPVKSIAAGAFANNKTLKTMYIPSSITFIGANAFAGCTSLVGITINALNTNYTFEGEQQNGVLYRGALYNASKTTLIAYLPTSTATSFTVPATVKQIQSGAFEGAVNLTSLNLANVENLGSNVFTGCNNLYDVIFDASNTNYSVLNGVIFNGDKTALVVYMPYNQNARYTVPNTVTSVLGYAFSGNGNIQSVVFNGNVREIHTNAFYGCYQLFSVTFNAEIMNVFDYAFGNCTNLVSFYVESDLTYLSAQAFSGSNNVVVYSPKGEQLELFCENNSVSFVICESAKHFNVEISAGVVSIIGTKDELFRFGRDNISLLIPSYINGYKVAVIGDNAFSETGLSPSMGKILSIYIPSTVEAIGTQAFYDCVKLKYIYFGGDIRVVNGEILIGSAAFTNINNSASVIVSNLNSNIAGYFNTTYGITCEIANPDSNILYVDAAGGGLIVIGLANYVSGNSISRIVIPASVNGVAVVEIAESAFENSNLISISIPSSVHTIGRNAFKNSLRLTSIYMQGGINIGIGAFANCSRLTTITLPASLNKLGARAFAGCTNLASVFFKGDIVNFDPSGISGVDINAFTNTDGTIINSNLTVYGPATRIALGEDDPIQSYLSIYCQTMKIRFNSLSQSFFYQWTMEDIEYVFDNVNNYYVVTKYNGMATSIIIPSVIYSIENNQVVFYPVKEIGENAFLNNTTLTSVTLTESVTTIGNYAFAYMTKLTSIAIPKSVITIGNYAFIRNPMLTELYFEGDVSSIGTGILTRNTRESKVFGPSNGKIKNYFVDSVLYSDYVKYNSTINPQYLVLTLNALATEYTVAGLRSSVKGGHVSVVLPAYVNGLPITAISSTAFNNVTTLYELTIPSTVKN
ncbi:MAG: leucine-rich repeat domain-containing protein, partial [Clostridia bacterium]|nr:leucine-rich repeat domain-containing protein [Clostridia bacterium]